MTDRNALINEINQLPDFIIKQVLDIVHYIKLGIESEYVSKTDNDFYNSQELKNIGKSSAVYFLTRLTGWTGLI